MRLGASLVERSQTDAVSSSRDDAGSQSSSEGDILDSSSDEDESEDEQPLQKRLRGALGKPRVIEGELIEAKTICYCSNFDININEWFNEYENIEIFKLNMRKNLGKRHVILTCTR